MHSLGAMTMSDELKISDQLSAIHGATDGALNSTGGRTTISPPANVKLSDEGQVLASGFDALVIALTLSWKHGAFFKLLQELKALASLQKQPAPGIMKAGADVWIFNVRPHGTEGYEWLLNSHDYDIKVLQAMQPRSRPSAMIEIRSATLWRIGAIEAIDRILRLFEGSGAVIQAAKTSRVDECLDILIPESIWKPDLAEHVVMRANDDATYRRRRVLTGFSLGSGKLSARLYDKPLEIKTKSSKKKWMYDVWGIEDVPAGGHIVRVEFQLRREALVEVGIDSIGDLINHPRSLWAYCTEHWLKIQDDAKLHHTQQKTLPWWKTVQHGFMGGQPAYPLIRAKIVNANKIQISQQLLGQLTSLIALESDGDITPGGKIAVQDHLSKIVESAELIGMSEGMLHERVRRKIAKYLHAIGKFRAAERERESNGLPVMRKRQSGGKGCHAK
jgi:hypothetical protein